MAIAVDGSSPIRFTGTPTSGLPTLVSASFTAPANSLIVVTIQGDGSVAGTVTNTVTDSGGLTWTKQAERTNAEATAGGGSVIWTAPQVTSAARTVTITNAHSANASTPQRVSSKIYVLTGVDLAGTPVDTVGANNEGGSSTNNLTTTSITPGANGLLIASDCDWNQLGNFEASSDLTQDTADYTGEISVCSGYKTCTSGVGVTANLNAAGAAAAQHKWTQIIVREAAAGGTTLTPGAGAATVAGRLANLAFAILMPPES